MFDGADEVHDDFGVQALDLGPQLIRGKLLLVGDIEIQVPWNGLCGFFDVVQLLY